MRRFVLTIVALGSGWAAAATAQAPPATDIFVGLLRVRDGRPEVRSVFNLTARDVYDNQPSWSPDGQSLYYTSTLYGGQADIFRRERADGGPEWRVTSTAPESEYSATMMPGGGAISVIRVEADSTQRLWRIPLDGGAASVILERVKPVGYHAWADSVTLALFVLGNPVTLQVADTRTGRADTVTTNIGRSLHRMPDSRRISFVHKASRDEWWLSALDPQTRATERLVRMPPGVEDYAWTPDGTAVAGVGSTLVMWRPGRAAWEQFADLAASGLTQITRLAVAPTGDAIAIVALPVAR